MRAAEPDPGSSLGWRVNAWVKQGILLGFRLGTLEKMGGDELSFVDKNTYPARRFGMQEGVRVVPGGSSIREGAYLARGVVCMPPMYVNAGAYVDEGTMVDSHALGRQLCPNREAGALECRCTDRRGVGASQRHAGDH